MIEDDFDKGWKQHFPTYHFAERDIAIEEYKVAAKSLEAEERVFLNASNITLVASAAIGSVLVGSSERLTTSFSDFFPAWVVSSLLLIIVLSFSFISLKYFADRQRAIIFAGRKVIVLRRMLGLSYGQVQLLLPNWRVEGADQPLALKLFPGWMSYAAYPFWVISIISSSVFFFLAAYFLKQYPEAVGETYRVIFLLSIPALWLLIGMFIYRTALMDTHESLRLLFYRMLSKLLRVQLTENIEYIIYRAKLAVYETFRLKIDTSELIKFLIFIEDRDFYKHSGISYKSLFRSILGVLGFKPKSGGSTIAQQLIRTLFIRHLHKKYRRKLLELGLAPWLNQALPKDMLLQIYLASVRFEKGKYGVVEAMNFYWSEVIKVPSPAQAFFLIERVSNVRSRLLVNKIIDTIKYAQRQQLLSDHDILEIGQLYKQAVQRKKIISFDDELTKLVGWVEERNPTILST